ncbi:hypothetical protein A6R68_19792 [Neotoma lepida]|uniref:Uncharacterized protein n=1 Tax=Neotoma lepida TaxID=56216 RepID=A0A1A6HGX9_NEOLE|nr:hypothetical protein A6R68_19792 [Neotoma lepida]
MGVEGDLVKVLQEFGLISYAVVMPRERQTLCEFEDMMDCGAVNKASINLIPIADYHLRWNSGNSRDLNSTSKNILKPV